VVLQPIREAVPVPISRTKQAEEEDSKGYTFKQEFAPRRPKAKPRLTVAQGAGSASANSPAAAAAAPALPAIPDVPESSPADTADPDPSE